MSEASKQLVRRLIEGVWVGCSATAAGELTARKYTEHAAAPLEGPAPGLVDGPQYVLGVGRWLREQLPDLHITIEALIAEGDTIAVRTSSEGTNLGKFSGLLPATGKRFVSCQSHWFRVADGKLVEPWAVRDDLSTVLQLGNRRAAAGTCGGRLAAKTPSDASAWQPSERRDRTAAVQKEME